MVNPQSIQECGFELFAVGTGQRAWLGEVSHDFAKDWQLSLESNRADTPVLVAGPHVLQP